MPKFSPQESTPQSPVGPKTVSVSDSLSVSVCLHSVFCWCSVLAFLISHRLTPLSFLFTPPSSLSVSHPYIHTHTHTHESLAGILTSSSDNACTQKITVLMTFKSTLYWMTMSHGCLTLLRFEQRLAWQMGKLG